MVRNESFMLPRWLRYYSEQLGAENLIVLDDNSTDGSTSHLDVSVLRVPQIVPRRSGSPEEMRKAVQFDGRRTTLVNNLARGLLQYVDTVIYVDVDEFLVPRPRTGLDLRGYLDGLDEPVVAGVGLNLLHQPSIEGPFDPQRGILEQRRHVSYVTAMCKPAIKQVDADWLPGFHGCRHEYRVDPDLLLLHAKFFDVETALSSHRSRSSLFSEGVGGKSSTWRISVDEFAEEMEGWQRGRGGGGDQAGKAGKGGQVRRLNVDNLNLDIVQERSPGSYRSKGAQLRGMRRSKLFRLPESLRDQF